MHIYHEKNDEMHKKYHILLTKKHFFHYNTLCKPLKTKKAGRTGNYLDLQ